MAERPPPRCTCAVWDPEMHQRVAQICGAERRTFVCGCCQRSVPWCFGTDGDMPDACDDCWAEAHAEGKP